MNVRGRTRRDERGAILIVASVGMVIAMIASGLAIDLGRLAQAARESQKVADMAALDAVRVLPGPFDQTDPLSVTMAAKASATRNQFPYSTSGYNLAVSWAPTVSGPFSVLPADLGTAQVVRIEATKPHSNAFPFIGGRNSISRFAVAEKQNVAGFTIGSSLVTINSSTSTLLNPILSQWLGGSVNLSLVSWQGLAGGRVTLSALQTALIDMGISAGTVSQMLDADLTLAQIFQATATALTTGGDTANASIMDALRLQAVSATTVKLGQMITVEQGADDAALGSQLNVFQLVTGSAQVANGSNAVSVPNVGITVPNVASLGLTLRVIEGPKTYIGTAGTGPHVTTGQVALTLTPQIEVLNLLGLVKVTGAFPVELHAGGATGTLKSIECPQKNIVVTADPAALAGALRSSALQVTTLLNINLLTVNTSNVTAAVDGPAQDLSFSYDSQFSPPNNFSKHIGSQPLGLQSLNSVSGTTANVNVLGLLSLGLSSDGVLAAVLSMLDNVVGALDANVLTPLFMALGIDIGGADVTALGADAFGTGLPQCGRPGLAA
jgi:uncharacterized membrane protein